MPKPPFVVEVLKWDTVQGVLVHVLHLHESDSLTEFGKVYERRNVCAKLCMLLSVWSFSVV